MEEAEVTVVMDKAVELGRKLIAEDWLPDNIEWVERSLLIRDLAIDDSILGLEPYELIQSHKRKRPFILIRLLLAY